MKALQKLEDTEATPHHPAPNSYFGYYYSIAQSKYSATKTILVRLEQFILSNYQKYQQNFQQDTLEMLSPTTHSPENKNALLNCYKSITEKLSELKLAIKNAQTAYQARLCQYCGINAPNTFDHYLPKDEFPEFSVMPLNLIPCCSNCNSIKSENWKDVNGRLFLNFYLDKIDNHQFLHADFIIYGNIPKIVFRLEKPLNMPKPLFSIVEKHFNSLATLEKYNEHSAVEYAQIIETIKDFDTSIQLTPTQIKDTLARRAQREEMEYGKNFWKVVLIKTIVASNVILQNILQLRLGK